MEKICNDYAPVLIPTLNRVDHLKRLIESLKKNKEAINTELYIAIDYPPNEKYVDGYKEMLEYVPTIDGFKKVNIIKREYNWGAFENSDDLIRMVSKKYKWFINTEDDNEFSEDFLGYMNGMLKYFENDPEIFAICAMNDTHMESKGSVFKMEHFCPYGNAYWVDKWEKAEKEIDLTYWNNIRHRFFRVVDLWKNNGKLFECYIADIGGDNNNCRSKNGQLHAMTDIVLNTYMRIERAYCIFPQKSLSKNWGNDGSGVHGAGNTGYVDDGIVLSHEIHSYQKEDLDGLDLSEAEFDWRMWSKKQKLTPKKNLRCGAILFLALFFNRDRIHKFISRG